MKKMIACIAVLLLLFAMSGCGARSSAGGTAEFPSAQNGQMPGDKGFDGPRGQYGPGGTPGQMPMNPAENRDPAEALTGAAPVIEGELFTSADLDSSPDLASAAAIPAENGSRYIIDSAGTYVLSGEAENFTLIVEASKEDTVRIVLDNAVVSNDNFPVIYVKSAEKCIITSAGSNALTVSGKFTPDGDTNTDAVIFSQEDLTLNGTGSLTILSAAGNGITSKDNLRIAGGSYAITCALDGLEAKDSVCVYDGSFSIETQKDGIHCEKDGGLGWIYIRDGVFAVNAGDDGIQGTAYLVIDGGEFQITAQEGLEATYVRINGGVFQINASDDGINASAKSDAYDVVIEINGGEITVVAGPGDTDCLDANGTIIVSGGTLNLTGQSAFDADNGSIYNGGTIIVNGVEMSGIPSSGMGGGRPHW